MISKLIPMPIGNALKLFLAPPASAQLWRVLRKPTNAFVDQDDPNAIVVFQSEDAQYCVDATGLMNGTPYSYCAFYFDGTAWTASAVVTATPNATYDDQSTDVLSIVRDRLDVGLQVEVARGTLTPQEGSIPVLNAPPVFDETSWPLVTVHVITDGSSDRALGEAVSAEQQDVLSGDWEESEGWLAHVHLTIVAWSKNPDERIALRKALRRLVIGNLAVFDAAGMTHIDFAQTDADALEGYPVPVYRSECQFTCLAPALVTSSSDSIVDISSSFTTSYPDRSASIAS